MDINNLSKEELVKLRQDVDDRLKTIEIKNTKPKKRSLMSLKKGDKILGIRLSFGGHRLVEPEELNGDVDIVDYCKIEEMDLTYNKDIFGISISHPTKPFGISRSLCKEEYLDEHCYLCIDTMKTGYDGFYTLKPETWKEDLVRMFNKTVETKKKYFQEELNILESKVKLFIDAEKKINEHI